MVIVYKHEEPEEEVLFKDKETAEYFRNYFYKDDNIAYVRIDEIEEEQVVEIERQWLFDIDKMPERFCSCHKDMEQSYLNLEPEVRLRKETSKSIFESDPTYWITIKGNGDLSREEINKEITKEEYEALKRIGNITEDKVIRKIHWETYIDQYKLELNIVDKGTENEFCYGEIEFASEEEALAFEPLDWFGEEVTYDNSYKMKNYWKRTRLGND